MSEPTLTLEQVYALVGEQALRIRSLELRLAALEGDDAQARPEPTQTQER